MNFSIINLVEGQEELVVCPLIMLLVYGSVSDVYMYLHLFSISVFYSFLHLWYVAPVQRMLS